MADYIRHPDGSVTDLTSSKPLIWQGNEVTVTHPDGSTTTYVVAPSKVGGWNNNIDLTDGIWLNGTLYFISPYGGGSGPQRYYRTDGEGNVIQRDFIDSWIKLMLIVENFIETHSDNDEGPLPGDGLSTTDTPGNSVQAEIAEAAIAVEQGFMEISEMYYEGLQAAIDFFNDMFDGGGADGSSEGGGGDGGDGGDGGGGDGGGDGGNGASDEGDVFSGLTGQVEGAMGYHTTWDY